MVLQCFVCKKLDYLNPNLTFHRIPADVYIRRTWISILNLTVDAGLTVPKEARICSAHFLDTDFEYKGATNRRLLKVGAAPAPVEEIDSSSESTAGGSPKRQRSVKHLLFEGVSDEEPDPSTGSTEVLISTSSRTITANECGNINLEEPCMEPELPQHKDSSELAGVRSLPLSSTLIAFEKENQMQLDSKTPSNVHLHQKASMIRKRPTAENVSSSDFSTPMKAKIHYQLMKSKLGLQQRKSLQQSVRRLRARVTLLKSLITIKGEGSNH